MLLVYWSAVDMTNRFSNKPTWFSNNDKPLAWNHPGLLTSFATHVFPRNSSWIKSSKTSSSSCATAAVTAKVTFLSLSWRIKNKTAEMTTWTSKPGSTNPNFACETCFPQILRPLRVKEPHDCPEVRRTLQFVRQRTLGTLVSYGVSKTEDLPVILNNSQVLKSNDIS